MKIYRKFSIKHVLFLSTILLLLGRTSIGDNILRIEGPRWNRPTGMEIYQGGRKTWGFLSANQGGGFRFYIGSGKMLVMSMGQDGNVGIGTEKPQAKFDVDGTIRTKVLEISGADLSERFEVKGTTDPGSNNL